MEIKKIDATSFSVTTAVETTYSIGEIHNQLRTLNARIAQTISNAQEAAKVQVQPMVEEIAQLTELLNAAAAQGIDTTPAEAILESADLVAELDTTSKAALDIASPKLKLAPPIFDIASSTETIIK